MSGVCGRRSCRPAAVELGERAAEISDAVMAYISERLPDLLDNAEALEANRASTEASIRDFAEVLQSGADPVHAARLGSATLAYAQDGAQHGVPLTVLLRSYRLGHAATSQHLNAILANHVADADELNRATELCSAWMFAYVDTALCLAEDVYTTERERWLRSAAASQAETIGTILSGQPIDIDVASRRLRHELRRVHVAAIAWLDTHEEGRNTAGPARSRHPRHRRGDRQPATPHPAPRHTVGRSLDQHQRRRTVAGPRRAAVPDRDGTRRPCRDRRTRAAASRDFAPAISRHSKRSGSPGWPVAARAASPATTTSPCAHSPPQTLSRPARFVERELGPLASRG